nr:HAMP domain-containing sensor histidine kinase [Oxynema sp. CENA135]
MSAVVFDHFYRASVGSISGTGLGLAIVQKCVEIHHGAISVTSELDRGSTFEVSLPLSDEGEQ